jgi:hypothetical protein
MMIEPGRYRHYKGHEYEVLGVARHSETEEDYVVYRALYGDRGLWIRPTAMFHGFSSLLLLSSYLDPCISLLILLFASPQQAYRQNHSGLSTYR